MATVTKRVCDRCKKEIDFNVGWTAKIKSIFEPKESRATIFARKLYCGNPSGYDYSDDNCELCADCTKEFNDFLYKGEGWNRWNLVSERMPKEHPFENYSASNLVAVTAKDLATGKTTVFLDYTINGEWSAFDRGEKGREVIAWIEPYKEGE